MKDSKYYKKKFKKKEINMDKLSNLMSKLLLSIIFVLGSLIITNFSDNLKTKYVNNVLNKNMDFGTINKFYNKYIGGKEDKSDMVVANIDTNDSIYEKVDNSYKFTVGNEYPISVLKPGIIVYVGNKDNLGDTVIIQGNDGIDIWYSNVYLSDYSLYDYISGGEILGVNNDDYYMITIMKDGNPLEYEEYIA